MSSNNFYQVGQEENSGDSFNSAMAEKAPQGQPTSITTQHNPQPMTYDGNSGKVSEQGYATTNTADNTTITSSSGSPRAFATTGSDLISYKGLTIQASQMVAMNLMEVDRVTGKYQMVSEQAQQAAQPQAAPEPVDAHDAFQMTEAENQSVNSCIPESLTSNPAVMQTVTNRAIEGVVTGSFESTIAAFSQSSGQSPTEAANSVNKALSTFQNAADKYLGSTVGLPKSDIPEFYAWARTQPSELKGAINSIINANNFRALGKMVGTWSQSAAPSINALEAAGYVVSKGQDGKPTITIQGRTMSIASAAKARLI